MGICNGGGRRRTPLGHQKPRITANSQCRPSGGTMPGRRVRVVQAHTVFCIHRLHPHSYCGVSSGIISCSDRTIRYQNIIATIHSAMLSKSLILFNLIPPVSIVSTDIISEQYKVKCTDVDGQRGGGTYDLQARHTPEATLSRRPTESRPILLVGQICRSY